MKLKTKILIVFCTTLIVLLAAVGAIVCIISSKSSMKIVNNSVGTSTELAVSMISNQLEDYLVTVSVLGEDETMCPDAYTDAQRLAYKDEYVAAYGFTSGNILDKNGVSIEDGTSFWDREYVQRALAGEANVSDVTLSKLSGKYGVSIAAPIKDEGDIEGVIYFRMDVDFIEGILNQIHISDSSYAYIVDQTGNIIVHPDQSLILQMNITEQGGDLATLATEMLKGESGIGQYTYDGQEIMCGYGTISNTNGWVLVVASPAVEFTRASYHVVNSVIAVAIIAIIVGISVAGFLAKGIAGPIERVKDALVAVSEGDFSAEITRVGRQDEISVLTDTTADLLDTLNDIIGGANRVLGSIAEYDLTSMDMKNYPGEFDSLARSVNSIKMTLTKLISEVQMAVMSVDTGSRELADATQALSHGTVQQASSIQTVADDLGDVVDRINRNSENEGVINAKLDGLDHQIQSANVQMQELLAAVDEIETMSDSIQKIVGTIDAIAFQTNILSLNASVEAARAGDMGNGFAVVAEEVRSLAEKCSDSSKKTSDLINQCIKSIGNAKKCADATFDSLSDIVKDSAEIASAFTEISADTMEQANKSQQIQREIHTISDVIQTNTATVEETAASTAVLSEQAANLDEMVRNFKVTG